MSLHDTRLPHLLTPSAYHDEGHYRREVDQLFRRGWHFVATLASSGRPEPCFKRGQSRE